MDSVCVLSRVQLFMITWTVTCQAPLSMEFPRQEYWSRLPFPTQEIFPDPGIKPASPVSPILAGGFFTTEPPGKPQDENISHHPGCTLLHRLILFLKDS